MGPAALAITSTRSSLRLRAQVRSGRAAVSPEPTPDTILRRTRSSSRAQTPAERSNYCPDDVPPVHRRIIPVSGPASRPRAPRINQSQSSLFNLAKVESAADRADQAVIHIRRSLELAETLRADIASLDLRASYVASVRDRHELEVGVLMRLKERVPDWKVDDEATGELMTRFYACSRKG